MKFNPFILLFFVAILSFGSCTSDSNSTDTVEETYELSDEPFDVIIHNLSDPKQLNPANSTDNAASQIYLALFQELVNIDFKTNELIPVLAKEMPTVTTIDEENIYVDFEIRPEATWDNGSPITAEDVAFCIKLTKIPTINNAPRRPYFEYIQDIEIDEANPKKFRLVCKTYFGAVNSIPDIHIIPSYVYDEENALADYSVNQLVNTPSEELAKDPKLLAFSEKFNSPKFQREVIVGSGPYTFDSWDAEQMIIVKKKENWWGDQLVEESHWFEAYPNRIIFKTINDMTTAAVALKSGEIDAMRSINQQDFVNDMLENERFQATYNTYTPPLFSYDYIGCNMRDPILEEKAVRKALAHIMDVDQLIETACYGLGERVASFTHPSKTKFLNPDVQPIPHDIDKAKELLAEAGWADTNGDGVLDKEIEGERRELELDVLFNKGNTRRQTTCLIFKEKAEKAGLKINILELPWNSMREKVMNREYQLLIGGWLSSPLESDPKQHWHSASANGGSNYGGFSNKEADDLIDALRKEMDIDKRAEMIKQLHQIIQDEMPYIFLLAQTERIAINGKFANTWGSGIKPGFWYNGFRLKKQPAE